MKCLTDTFASASCNIYFTISEGPPPLNEAALSHTWSSSTFSNKQQLFSFLSQLSQHEKLNVFPGPNTDYPKNSWPASQWQKLLWASLSNRSNPNDPPQKCWRAPFINLSLTSGLQLLLLYSVYYILISLKRYFRHKSLGPLLSSNFCLPLTPAVLAKQKDRAKQCPSQKSAVQAPWCVTYQNN